MDNSLSFLRDMPTFPFPKRVLCVSKTRPHTKTVKKKKHCKENHFSLHEKIQIFKIINKCECVVEDSSVVRCYTMSSVKYLFEVSRR